MHVPVECRIAYQLIDRLSVSIPAISHSRSSTYRSVLDWYGLRSRVSQSVSVSSYIARVSRSWSHSARIRPVRSRKRTVQFSLFFELSSLGIRRTAFSVSTHPVTARWTSIGRKPASKLTQTRLGIFHPLARSQSASVIAVFGFSKRWARYTFQRDPAAGSTFLYFGMLPYSRAASRICDRSSCVR